MEDPQREVDASLVVTRHEGLVNYLISEGIVDETVPVMEHVESLDVLGKDVIGNLPTRLAAHAASVVEVDLDCPPECRGEELSEEQVREFCQGITRYRVTIRKEIA